MKNTSKVLSAILAGALTMGTVGASVSTAMADSHQGYQSTTLPIRAIHGNTVTLVDGSTYTVPYGFDVSKLHVGERVSITWKDDKGSTTNTATFINQL